MWEHLYKIESGRDVGTLYYFRNLFGRNNVKQKVKDGFAPAEDLFLQVFILSKFVLNHEPRNYKLKHSSILPVSCSTINKSMSHRFKQLSLQALHKYSITYGE